MAANKKIVTEDPEEKIVEIQMERLRPFRNHPYKVEADYQMAELMESIKKFGIINPLVVRPMLDGYYEIISGHRRMHAAKLAGLTMIPAIVREMTDDEAVVYMVDSNIQREELLPCRGQP